MKKRCSAICYLVLFLLNGILALGVFVFGILLFSTIFRELGFSVIISVVILSIMLVISLTISSSYFYKKTIKSIELEVKHRKFDMYKRSYDQKEYDQKRFIDLLDVYDDFNNEKE